MFWRRRPSSRIGRTVMPPCRTPGLRPRSRSRHRRPTTSSRRQARSRERDEVGAVGAGGGAGAGAARDGDGLSAGVERSRGGFVARLKGLLGRGDPDAATWEAVEETLIGGDVGATLALEVVERARRRREAGGPVAPSGPS